MFDNLPQVFLYLYLNDPQFVSDGFVMLQHFMDTIDPNTDANKLHNLSIFANLDLADASTGQQLLATARMLKTSLAAVDIETLISLRVIQAFDSAERYDGIVNSFKNGDTSIVGCSLEHLATLSSHLKTLVLPSYLPPANLLLLQRRPNKPHRRLQHCPLHLNHPRCKCHIHPPVAYLGAPSPNFWMQNRNAPLVSPSTPSTSTQAAQHSLPRAKFLSTTMPQPKPSSRNSTLSTLARHQAVQAVAVGKAEAEPVVAVLLLRRLRQFLLNQKFLRLLVRAYRPITCSSSRVFSESICRIRHLPVCRQ